MDDAYLGSIVNHPNHWMLVKGSNGGGYILLVVNWLFSFYLLVEISII